MTTTTSRVVGSGFTALFFQGKSIALLDRFNDLGQAPLGTPYEAVHSIGHRRVQEIAVQRVMSEGRITVTLREAWNQPAWAYLIRLAGGNPGTATTIAEAQEALDRLPGGGLTMSMIVTPPGNRPVKRGKTYHGMVITNLDEGEDITVGGLTVAKNIQFVYTHVTPYATR